MIPRGNEGANGGDLASLVNLVTAALADESADGMAAVDRELRFVYWNRAMARIFGVDARDVLGRRPSELAAFQADAGGDDAFRRALAGELVEARDCPFIADGGDRRGYYDARYTPCRDSWGVVTGVIAIVRDVSERKLAEGKLEEIESRFRSMADASPVMLWTAGGEALRTFFNKTWLDFVGRTLDQEWGVGWVEGVHADDFQTCMDAYIAACGARRPFEVEYRLRQAGGGYRVVLDRGTPRYSADGRFAGYIGSCVDLTDRRRTESDLRQAVHARDEFLAIASHELRTPLTALQLHLENLMRAVQRAPGEALTTGRLERTTVSAVAQSARMAALIEEMLDVSRIAEGRLPLAYEDVDLEAVVRESVERVRRVAADGGSPIELTAEGPQPGRWDRERLEQVMTNLLSNAIKYGDRKPITVVLAGDGEHVRITVEDRGIGIPRAHQARIFERFERAVSARNYGGLGLGLWTCKRIVEALGGEIDVDSEPGQGAVFTVTLPRFPRDATSPVPPAPPSATDILFLPGRATDIVPPPEVREAPKAR
jgi:PAS domain S-box-containing protein